MRTAAVALSMCLLVLHGGTANPLFLPRIGEITDQTLSDQPPSDQPPSDQATTATTVSHPAPSTDAHHVTSTLAPIASTPLPTLAPGELPTPPAPAPSKPSATVIVVSLDPSKLIPSLSAALQLPFDPISVAANMLRPLATWPLIEARQSSETPFQPLKNVVHNVLDMPKEVVDTGEKVVDNLLDTIRKL